MIDFTPDLSKPLALPKHDSWPDALHRFDENSMWAVRMAIASGRPLLLRGEAGVGKSQLARAVAVQLKVPFLYHVIHERSERDELLYYYDAVARLAEAQVSALVAKEEDQESQGNWRISLAERNFIRPGVLWWAYNWNGATKQADLYKQHCRNCEEPRFPTDWTPIAERPCGPVVLIDEIDKADPSVPNGLLESLGNQGFRTTQLDCAVELAAGAKPPLVIITTNEERELPFAFLRRCLVLHMELPRDLIAERARVYWTEKQVSVKVCKLVLEQLTAERKKAEDDGLAKPGAAEFLDILRALDQLHPNDEKLQLAALEKIAGFALKKNAAPAP